MPSRGATACGRSGSIRQDRRGPENARGKAVEPAAQRAGLRPAPAQSESKPGADVKQDALVAIGDDGAKDDCSADRFGQHAAARGRVPFLRVLPLQPHSPDVDEAHDPEPYREDGLEARRAHVGPELEVAIERAVAGETMAAISTVR